MLDSNFRLLPPFAEKQHPVGIRQVNLALDRHTGECCVFRDVAVPLQALLTKNEGQLLAVSRDVANCLIQADLEAGQVTRVWTPKRLSVPLSLTMLCNETPAAQLDNRDTFLALGPDWCELQADIC